MQVALHVREMNRRIVAAIAAVVFVVASGNAVAQTPGDFFKGKSGCKMWWSHGKDPEYHSTVSADWRGSCRSGLAQGHGTFEVVEKYQYKQEAPILTVWTGEGDAVGGKLSGRAFYVAEGGKDDKQRVEGEFRDGVLNGKGIQMTEFKGQRYRTEGEFRDGRLNGWGVREKEFPWEDGKAMQVREEGEFRDGKLNGRGVAVTKLSGCTAQSRYEGEYKDDLYDGRGTLTTYAGKVYTGVWQRGDLNGRSALFQLNRDVLCR